MSILRGTDSQYEQCGQYEYFSLQNQQSFNQLYCDMTVKLGADEASKEGLICNKLS